MLNRRSLLVGLSAAAACAAVRPARATTARALSLFELVRQSQARVVATAVDKSSTWEVVGGRKRIVTYTVLRVDGALDDRSPDTGDLAVRTLGGQVAGVGQIVHGEPALAVGERAGIFLEALGTNVFAVTAMAQGHYPVIPEAGGALRLTMSPRLPALVRTGDAAVLQLHGLTVTDARTLIAKELARGAR
jgi:hypothetical protein